MRQQINLLQDALEDRKPLLPASQVVLLMGIMLLLSVLGAGFANWRATLPAAELQQLSAEVERLRETMDSLSTSAAAITRDPTLEVKQVRLERELSHLLRMSAATASPPDATPLSAILAGTGRQRPEGLWLIRLHVSSTGSLMMQGNVLDAALLPDYISRLGNEPAFRGLRFAELELARDIEHGDWLNFKIMAGCEGPDCPESAQAAQ